MTIRTLFNIILKILGVLIIKDVLLTVPQLFSIILYLTKSVTITEGIWTLVTTLLVLCADGLVSYYLVFKTNLIIDKLKLDEDFDEESISLNMHRSTVLSISIIVVGGLLITNEIPNLCQQLFSYFQEKSMTYGLTNPTILYSLASGVKIIIGYLLMTKQRQIVNFIELQRKE